MINKEMLLNKFSYEDGNLYWKNPTSNRVKIGQLAGAVDNKGYRRIRVNGKDYLAHRLIFLYHNGWLPRFVDHKDCDPTNNRIENLRPLTHSENIANGKTTTSKTGYRGVSQNREGKYFAQIMKHYKNHHLGFFETPEEAHEAYLKAREQLFPGVNV